MSQKEISEIASRVKEARKSYFNLDPTISDMEFDALKSKLQELDPFHEEILFVGAEAPSDAPWAKADHEIPMGSLDKVNAKEEFVEWATKTGASSFIIIHKLDGSSLELVYENGILKKCVTRGNGNVGDDITINAIKIPTIPRKIETTSKKVIVRGEVIMLKKMFDDNYSDEYANPRNTAAGKLRDKKNEGEDCKNLLFVAFSAIGTDVKTEFSLLENLYSLGFVVPLGYEVGDIQYMCQRFEKSETDREIIPYEIDGMVIRIDDLEKQTEMGEKNMKPLGQIAWKFDPATSISKVLDIKWQVGPSGRVTPVATIEPVNIGGVVITSVSLHNISLFQDLKLSKGCEVLVSRRNDVIPYIEQNLSLEA